MKQVTSEGLLPRRNQQSLLQQIWKLSFGIFSVSMSGGLLNAVYFCNCKFFGLRAGDEHLCVEQYSFASHGVCEYIVFNGQRRTMVALDIIS